MNKESIKNRRIVAIIIVVALLALSLGADILNVKVNKLQSEQSFLMSQFDKKLNSKELKEITLQDGNVNERIMVVSVNGAIDDSGGGFYGSGYNHSETLESLEEAMVDDSIKGIILAVDSPGGTVYHSAELWKKIMQVKENTDIKIYTSMGTYAASGGYYIAAPSDKIFASEETVTGSIGVIADYVNYAGLEEKLGIKHNVIKSGSHKDIASPNREMTEEERFILQESVMESYEKFLDVVSTGRKIPKDKLRPIADGRIYSGNQAVKNNLVDEIGYYDDVVEAMTKDLGLKNPEIFQKTSNSTDYLSSFLGFNLKTFIKSNNAELDTLREVKNMYGVNNSTNILYMLGGY